MPDMAAVAAENALDVRLKLYCNCNLNGGLGNKPVTDASYSNINE